jgi:hypothetical protein
MSWKKVGSLRKSKNGGFYLKFDESVSVKKDSTLTLLDPRKSLETSVANGKLTQEKADEIAGKIPDYIRYEVFVAPNKE